MGAARLKTCVVSLVVGCLTSKCFAGREPVLEGRVMKAGRKWRRTAVELSGKLVPLRDGWSLHDAASDVEIARIARSHDGDWSCLVRAIREGELKEEAMNWHRTGAEAKAYAE